MRKFPVLDTIRIINFGLGILIIGAGFFYALDSASVETRGETIFQFGTFITTFGGAIVISSFMLLVAELINVILRMEDHLDNINRSFNHQFNTNSQSSSADQHNQFGLRQQYTEAAPSRSTARAQISEHAVSQRYVSEVRSDIPEMTAGDFDLIVDYIDTDNVLAVQEVRRLLQIARFDDAKDFARNTPFQLLTGVSSEYAQQIQSRLALYSSLAYIKIHDEANVWRKS